MYENTTFENKLLSSYMVSQNCINSFKYVVLRNNRKKKKRYLKILYRKKLIGGEGQILNDTIHNYFLLVSWPVTACSWDGDFN